MPNQSLRIESQLPSHFREHYPDFVAFLKGYYEWLHRTDNVTPGELEMLKSDTSWQKIDIDGFIRTGEESLAGQSPLIDKIRETPPGTEADRLADDYRMERRFEEFETADGESFSDHSDRPMESTRVNEKHMNEWFSSFNFAKTADNLIENYSHLLTASYDPFNTSDSENVVVFNSENPKRYRTLDNIRLLKLLNHIYAIRGTEKAAELFFNIFFGETIETYNPKVDIMVADDCMVLDSAKRLRDDEVFNEFTYVILTNRDPAEYDFFFRTIFLTNFHPAGFKVHLQKNAEVNNV